MSTLTDLMTHDHRQCDEAFASAEHHVGRGEWEAARAALGLFSRALNTHFGAEESILFPRFEQATGMMHGPTMVMREEHRELRAALARLEQAIDDQDADEYTGEAETLLILMQQHNMKEENILYPMCDQRLQSQREDLALALGRELAAGHQAEVQA
ncbi:hemerythrin domain-containing protein [Thauera sp. CAU 1555]|uniref:Hemerythrin domain-containing protein n=1 Tax=Thauera sedimentorum TaxID=2767595 RepID=A0ABR9B8A6_9RHOO|nr:hemerythrin domain-containing protein [Thauera sedimentorum]MBC9071487.1 hemerythrin domain-containing protein [Thauera sedimentorum]MBD8502406.1 hemerythrin domain-containing protein [Thauera sedimentorum]